MWLGAADGRDTHIVIFQRVDLLNEPLDYLLFVEPLGVRKAAGLCSLAATRPAYPTPARHGPPTQTHIDHVLSQLGPLHTSEETQQQVHDGRGADVLQQQVHKVILLPQEGHQLGALVRQEAAPGCALPPAREPGVAGTWSVLRLMRMPMTLLKKLASKGLRQPLLCRKP